MFQTLGTTIPNPDESRFLITLDDEFRCPVELAYKIVYLVGAGVFPAFKLSYLEFSGSSLANQ